MVSRASSNAAALLAASLAGIGIFVYVIKHPYSGGGGGGHGAAPSGPAGGAAGTPVKTVGQFGGVGMVYQSGGNGNSWLWSGKKDCRGPNAGAISGSGPWKGNTRNEVFSDQSFPSCTSDACVKGPWSGHGGPQSQWRTQGYMYKPSDWTNFEMTTMYVSIAYPVEHVMRGGDNSTQCAPCEGTNYHIKLNAGGAGHVEKDMYHNTCYSIGTGSACKFSSGGVLGFKTVVYNKSPTSVAIESFASSDGQNWRLVGQCADTEGQTVAGLNSGCRGSVGPCVLNGGKSPVTWGGPAVNFRCDSGQAVWKYLSLREISVGTAGHYARAKSYRGHVYTGSNYGMPLPTAHPYAMAVNDGIIHGVNDAYAYGATPTHVFNDMEPEYFDISREKYSFARAALSDSRFSEFMQKFMPPKEKREPKPILAPNYSYY